MKGILILKDPDYRAVFSDSISEGDLPEGDVTVRVKYSTLNYKDALAITGKGLIIRNFPMVPGIDFAGEVIESQSSAYRAGDEVILNGWGVGENHWGGLAELARVPAQYLTPKPDGLSLKDCMAAGTAGYTAMLCVQALAKNGVTPDKGDIVVSGANGGVGSFATALLAKLGYTVTALTRRTHESAYLTDVLGAAAVMDGSEYRAKGKPLAKERWAGAVDTLGSHTLANICAATRYGGTVAACGLAQGMDFDGTVAPFILRGITLAGIDSVMLPAADRLTAWSELAALLGGSSLLQAIGCHEISLEEVPQTAERLINGEIRGRVVVAV
ncbi:MDR family oxidoreductase [Neisseria sp.]|uniref:acrylyl-CoA reductase (NADPH) n=1 Tax=Neisseria sp. TaxID=192066 RepID=UPI0026DBA202|nr:MDR family oxidoreductase [Neisseria sp.]MDO4227025.1 MDR family oxidoreductase [Neisseria sp.]